MSISTSPLRPGTMTGAISHANVPSLLAASARDSDASANWSCASRVNVYFAAQSSAKVPIRRPLS